MNDEELKKEIEKSNKYVDNLKDCPEKRIKEIKIKDEVVFLKKDEKDDKLWNFGYGEVLAIENKEGAQKLVCKTENVKTVFLKSPSYPFQVYVEPKHLLKNYTAEKRG